jgi:gluconate 2-dehydrogenase gamma chain
MSNLSRRQFVTSAAASAAAAWLAFETRDVLAAGLHAMRAEPFQFLNAADAADLEAATAQIIPSDGSPGAREARVVHFIDRSLATFAKDQRGIFAKGVKELRKRSAKIQRGADSFAALSNEHQIAVIAALEKDKHPFFDALRGATIVGMLSTPEYGGNFEKTGWKLIGFNDQFSWAQPFGWYDRDV